MLKRQGFPISRLKYWFFGSIFVQKIKLFLDRFITFHNSITYQYLFLRNSFKISYFKEVTFFWLKSAHHNVSNTAIVKITKTPHRPKSLKEKL